MLFHNDSAKIVLSLDIEAFVQVTPKAERRTKEMESHFPSRCQGQIDSEHNFYLCWFCA